MVSLLFFSFAELSPEKLGDGKDEGEVFGGRSDEFRCDQGRRFSNVDRGFFGGGDRPAEFLNLLFHEKIEFLEMAGKFSEIGQGLLSLGRSAPELGEKTDEMDGNDDRGNRDDQKQGLIEGQGHDSYKIMEKREFVNAPG